MVEGRKGVCFGFVVFLLCFYSTFAHRLLMDPFPRMMEPHRDHKVKSYVHEPDPDFKVEPSLSEKDHENLPELERAHKKKPDAHELELDKHRVTPKIDPTVNQPNRGRKFGSGTSHSYGFGGVRYDDSGVVRDGQGAGGGGYCSYCGEVGFGQGAGGYSPP